MLSIGSTPGGALTPQGAWCTHPTCSAYCACAFLVRHTNTPSLMRDYKPPNTAVYWARVDMTEGPNNAVPRMALFRARFYASAWYVPSSSRRYPSAIATAPHQRNVDRVHPPTTLPPQCGLRSTPLSDNNVRRKKSSRSPRFAPAM